MIINALHSAELISPARTVVGRVELYEGSTLLQSFSHTDALSSFTLSRAGDKKFFGFGVSQEIEVKLVDRERAINIEEENILKTAFGVNGEFVYPNPLFYVSKVTRNENTNELTIIAQDAIAKTKSHTIAELGLQAPYTLDDVASAIAGFFGLTLGKVNVDNEPFSISYPEGANFDGAETWREALDAIAEVTQTIYYIDKDNQLIFKRLDMGGAAVLTIRKADYFTLESKAERTLASIVSATELGDNVSIDATGVEGSTQYVRDNPFWELREDIVTLLEAAIAAVGGFALSEFSCKWRGNYLLEPGDKIEVVAKDNSTVISYLLDEKYTYNGGFSADTSWEYGDNKNESVNNPTTLGAALKQTYAKVDKANKEIEIVAGETASIKLTTDSVQTTVTEMDENLAQINAEVKTKVTADDVSFSIQTALGEGVERVTTATGFTFNEEGLHVSKSDSDITTTITEDGMTVYRKEEEVLVADNLGVRAEDLHATTFLIIGKNSRLEDYNDNRTGCFWIGK